MKKIRGSLFLFILMVLLTSCVKQNVTSDNSSISIEPFTYSDRVIEYKLQDHNIPSSDLKQFFYIGDGKAVYSDQKTHDGLFYRCNIIDCKTGQILKEIDYHGSIIQYGNGFGVLRSGNNGILGRLELSVYDNNGELIDTIVPDGQQVKYLNLKNDYPELLSEFPITEQLTVRHSDKGVFLYNEITDSAELIFENTENEKYIVNAVLDENSFIIYKCILSDGAPRKDEYGIYSIRDKKLTVLDINNDLFRFNYNAIGKVLLPYENCKVSNNGGSFYYYSLEDGYNLKKKTLFETKKGQYFADMAISYDNNRFAILFLNKDEKFVMQSVQLILYNVSDMSIVFEKTIDLPENYHFAKYLEILSFMPNGTLAINLVSGDNDYLIYVIEPDQMKGNSNER